jgi:hypothetical protein
MNLRTNLICLLLMGGFVALAIPMVTAYPLGEGYGGDGGGGYYPPPSVPTPPGSFPTLPASGHYTVDCPSGGWMVDYYNAYDPYACVHRNGPATWLYSGRINYTTIARGWFPDTSQAYDWPKQVMPLSNATILSVYLITIAKLSSTDFYPPYPVGYLQYSIDGQDHYYPASSATNNTFNITNVASYQEYLYNVTTWQNWTPEMLLSPQTFVQLNVTGAVSLSPILIDYIGLRYNWTLGAIPGPSHVPYQFTFNFSSGSLIQGSLGVLGFAGLVICPAIGYIVMNRSENKVNAFIFTLMFGVFSFALFAWSTNL